MIFLLAVVGTAKPLEESSGVLLLFLQGLGGACPPQGSPGCGGGARGHVWGFARGGRLLDRDANPLCGAVRIIDWLLVLTSGSNLFSFVRKQHLTHIVIILLF